MRARSPGTAVATRRSLCCTSVNGRDQLADLLARHDRPDQLRAYAATEVLGHAAQRLAEMLEDRGDVEAAIGVYRQAGDSTACRANMTVQLAHLLARHRRGDGAIEVMRGLADASGAEDWIRHVLCTLCTDQGRPEDGLAYLDALKERWGEEEWDLFWLRPPLMAACDRVDEALARMGFSHHVRSVCPRLSATR
ncbi:tetratricopeptide repeat protein [Streptomyces olivaceoviridis]